MSYLPQALFISRTLRSTSEDGALPSASGTVNLAAIQATVAASATVLHTIGTYTLASGTIGISATKHTFNVGAILYIPAGVTVTLHGQINVSESQQWAQVDVGGLLLLPDVKRSISVMEFGADVTGAVACDVARDSAQAAVAPYGGTIYFPAGIFTTSTTMTPATKQIQLNQTRITGSGSSDLITTSSNVVVEGQGIHETWLAPPAGKSAIHLTGTWVQDQPGQPYFLAQRFTTDGGARAIDTAGLTYGDGFEEGRFLIRDVHSDNTTAHAFFVDRSVTYSTLDSCQTGPSAYGFAYIRDNTETYVTNPRARTTASGGAGWLLDGCHHVVVLGGSTIGATGNTNPDVQIKPRNFDASVNPEPSSCIIHYRDHKFGPEAYENLALRNRIIVGNSDNDYAAWQILFDGCDFYAVGMAISAMTRTSNIVTATITLPHDLVVVTDHGIQSGNLIHIIGCADASFNVDTVVATRISNTQISFPCVGSNVTVGAASIYSAQIAAVAMLNPMSQCSFKNCRFYNFVYAIDDTGDYNDSPHGKSGQCTFDSSNTITGPGGRAAFISKRGGFGFDSIDNSAGADTGGDSKTRIVRVQNRETRQRLTSTDLTTWTASAGITVTGGQIDDYGGTGAFKIERTGAGNTFASGGIAPTAYSLGESLSIVVPSSLLYATTWFGIKAKRATIGHGSIGTVTLGLLDTTHSKLFWSRNISLPEDGSWCEKEYPIVWTPSTIGATVKLVICPGDWLLQGSATNKAAVIVDRPRLSDFRSDYLPSSGVGRVDAKLGNRWERDVAVGGFRTMQSFAGAPSPSLVSGGGLGTGGVGGGLVLLQGNDLSGVLSMNLGSSGVASSGTLALTINRALTGTPAIFFSLESFQRTWDARASVRLASRAPGGSTYGFSFVWDNNGVVPTGNQADAFRINYWVIPSTTDGL